MPLGAAMTWFHLTKVDLITQARRTRREFAEQVRNSTFREEFYATNIRAVEETIRAAKREDELYAEYLGERMPDHMTRAVTLETGIWMTIHDLLFKPAVIEDEYPALCRKLRPYLAVLIDLLLMEEEMMTSPLTRHYVQLIDTLRTQAAGAKP
jgi:hypothetical protein